MLHETLLINKKYVSVRIIFAEHFSFICVLEQKHETCQHSVSFFMTAKDTYSLVVLIFFFLGRAKKSFPGSKVKIA